eukprot:scaffold20.g7886.t1
MTKLAVVMAAALVAVASAASATDSAPAELGPLCVSLANSMGVSPSLVSAFVPKLPSPPSAGICKALINDSSSPTAACDFITLLSFGLTASNSPGAPCSDATAGTGGQARRAPPRAARPRRLAGDAKQRRGSRPGACGAARFKRAPPACLERGPALLRLTPLKDRRPLPATFSDQAAVLKEEGPTYNWLWRTSSNALLAAPCLASDNGTLLVPPGWSLVATANLMQSSGKSLPMVYVVLNEATGQLVFISRGTIGSYEWSLDFQYNQSSADNITSLFGSPIEYGFAYIFGQARLWPTVQSALDTYVVSGKASDVYVTGHSLGAAQGSLISYAVFCLKKKKLGSKAPVISTVLFSPPNVGTSAFTASFDKTVNGRRIAYANDIVSQFPCPPSIPACGETPAGLLGTLGIKNIPTNQNASSYAYESIGGSIDFTSSQMPQDTATWEQIGNIPLCYAFDFLQASHLCSFQCFLSQYAGATVDNTLCWLSAKPADAPGTQCPTFPVPGYLSGAAAPAAAAAAAAASPTPSFDKAPATNAAAARGAHPSALLLAALAALLLAA